MGCFSIGDKNAFQKKECGGQCSGAPSCTILTLFYIYNTHVARVRCRGWSVIAVGLGIGSIARAGSSESTQRRWRAGSRQRWPARCLAPGPSVRVERAPRVPPRRGPACADPRTSVLRVGLALAHGYARCSRVSMRVVRVVRCPVTRGRRARHADRHDTTDPPAQAPLGSKWDSEPAKSIPHEETGRRWAF